MSSTLSSKVSLADGSSETATAVHDNTKPDLREAPRSSKDWGGGLLAGGPDGGTTPLTLRTEDNSTISRKGKEKRGGVGAKQRSTAAALVVKRRTGTGLATNDRMQQSMDMRPTIFTKIKSDACERNERLLKLLSYRKKTEILLSVAGFCEENGSSTKVNGIDSYSFTSALKSEHHRMWETLKF